MHMNTKCRRSVGNTLTVWSGNVRGEVWIRQVQTRTVTAKLTAAKVKTLIM